jgi:hypothetical protein
MTEAQTNTPGPWAPLGPGQFVDQRTRLTRDSGLVHQNVRAYHGVVIRKGANGKPEYERCPHAHNKPAAARKCAEAAAKRWNRLEAKKAAS